ncbi:ribbon-helix-helix domain-containing protein [Sphaerisporangium aureirubrum]|uniref:Ribbon-helix-helix domain-containing protein n=1 Tax=Sphaerisporangium aureirubrum TaxID=1544736 RepID=A0ABW1NC51_9ACTN
MAEQKGGRPKIGTPVTITVPEETRNLVDGIAAARGTTRSAILRELVINAVDDTPRPADLRTQEQVAPIAATLVQWIGADPRDGEQVRERFLLFRKCVNSGGTGMINLIETAWGSLYLSGTRDLEPPDANVLRRLEEPGEWQLRGVHLWVAVFNGLMVRQIHPAPGHVADEDQDDDPSAAPPEGEDHLYG